jgi:hypothetical protein
MRLALSASVSRGLAAATLALSLGFASAHAAATITIVNLDGPGEGFNDPTPAAPVGGNPGTTVGAQRLYVFQYAANIWGNLLYSNIETKVDAHFDPLDCDGSSAVLGSAGPNQTWANFPNAPKENTWYHDALANRLANEDLDPTTSEISANFNSDLGKPECFPYGWYYGVDGNESATEVELLPVVLHELGHGLGFSTTSLAGVQEVFPSIYDYFLYDNTQQMHWTEMTDPQRSASANNCSNLVWDGPMVTAKQTLGPKPLLRITSPGAIAGDYEVGLASFGASLTQSGVTGDFVYVDDGVALPHNGCEPIVNDVNGKVAFVDRGGCPFILKVKNCQDAGAIAMVVADSVPGCPPLGMSGSNATITIPSVRLTNDDGAMIKTQLLLGNTVTGTLRRDPALQAGADANRHVQVYTVVPFAPGSSVSHWDTAADPNLLMEPALNPDLSSDVDLTLAQFADIGWFEGLLSVPAAREATAQLRASWPNPTTTTATIGFSLTRAQHVDLSIYDVHGRLVRRLIDARLPEGDHSARWDGTDLARRPVAAGVYLYRMRSDAGEQTRHLVFVR